MATVGATALAEWGVAARPIPGESVSGDHHAAVPFSSGLVIAVIDGLGHGPEAALAASSAGDVVESHAHHPPAELLRRCHDALRHTRGAAITIASIDAESDELTWIGVGNVQAALLRPEDAEVRGRQWVPLRGGVVGYVLPTLRHGTVRLGRDDVLVLATDGVRPIFGAWPTPSEAPADVAARILEEQVRGSDDALVFVARYRGRAPSTNAA